MSNITFEREEVAVITELDEEKTFTLVGGNGWQPLKWLPIKWEPPVPSAPPAQPNSPLGQLPCDSIVINVKIDNKIVVDISTKDK
ncbi:MAG: hypothetical protein RMX96_27720 [Nostoc sp. ChiSLP02]|nr:hypothetical protein [Nostoc sp. DedSLP05]MDZ8098356.1 hypothetical protein [Nostoc sp. DedSLP01]MDZ8188630.1 hypothetical protein [Nostoc sp. ChiSLP02]